MRDAMPGVLLESHSHVLGRTPSQSGTLAMGAKVLMLCLRCLPRADAAKGND